MIKVSGTRGRVACRLRAICLILTFASASRCGLSERHDRLLQIRSVTLLQTIAAKLDQEVSLTPGSLSEKRAVEIVKSVNAGKDAWGNDIRVFVAKRGDHASYVIVSTGADGHLDFTSEADYFAMPRQSIHGVANRDIVFRDGEAVTLAGK